MEMICIININTNNYYFKDRSSAGQTWDSQRDWWWSCASSCPKKHLYESLLTPLADADFIKIYFRLLAEHTGDGARLLSTFPLKISITFTRCFSPWLKLSSDLIWQRQNKHFIIWYFSLRWKLRTSAWCSICFDWTKLFYHSSF